MRSLATILIPTFNRPEKLNRLLNFLKELQTPHRVIVLDGSAQDLKQLIQEIVSFYPFASLRSYGSELHLGLRCLDGLSAVQSEYVVFCADDDFVFPSAISDCVDFLDKNAGYAAAMGGVRALFYGNQGGVRGRAFAVADRLSNCVEFDQDEFIQRSLAYWSFTLIGSVPLFYCVRRTSEARTTFGLLTEKTKYSAMELLTNASLLISGKISILDTPFGLRDYSSEPIRENIRDDPSAYFEERDLEYVKEKLTLLLASQESLELRDAERTVATLISFCTHNFSIPRWQSPLEAWFDRKQFQLQRLLSIISPDTLSEFVGLDRKVTRALSKSLVLGGKNSAVSRVR